jgi:hypothetical protein
MDDSSVLFGYFFESLLLLWYVFEDKCRWLVEALNGKCPSCDPYLEQHLMSIEKGILHKLESE